MSFHLALFLLFRSRTVPLDVAVKDNITHLLASFNYAHKFIVFPFWLIVRWLFHFYPRPHFGAPAPCIIHKRSCYLLPRSHYSASSGRILRSWIYSIVEFCLQTFNLFTKAASAMNRVRSNNNLYGSRAIQSLQRLLFVCHCIFQIAR